jgi:thymidylate synthase
MTTHDQQYLSLLKDVIYNGRACIDRTGTGTIKVFGRQMRFDLSDGTIPLLTTKKMHLPAIFHEILWYLSGNGNIKYLQDNGIRIWNEWADENGDLGNVYGVQWRKWQKYELTNITDGRFYYEQTEQIDQIAEVIERLKTNPDDRRMLVNAWNVGELDDMKLPPCHYAFQFFSTEMTFIERLNWFNFQYPEILLISSSHDVLLHTLDEYNIPTRMLSCKLTQRSCDVFLGVPFNISQYSVLTRMIAEVVGMAPGEFIWDGGDVHIYSNHLDQVNEQLTRTPFESPTLRFARAVDNIDDFTYDDFIVENYEFHPAIKAKVSV